MLDHFKILLVKGDSLLIILLNENNNQPTLKIPEQSLFAFSMTNHRMHNPESTISESKVKRPLIPVF